MWHHLVQIVHASDDSWVLKVAGEEEHAQEDRYPDEEVGGDTHDKPGPGERRNSTSSSRGKGR